MSTSALHPEAEKLADWLRQQPLDLNVFEQAIAQFAATADPGDYILPGWYALDVQILVYNRSDKKLTVSRDDATKVLKRAKACFDAGSGINWDSLYAAVQDLIADGEIMLKQAEKQLENIA